MMNNITAFNAMDNAALDSIVQDTDARSGQAMLQSICDLLARFVCYPSEHALVAHALWCVHTHLMDKWDSTPRIAFLSPEPGSGKTRALEITELVVPSPVQAINVSPAYLFRKVGAEEGATILFDEVDTVFGPKARENEELRGLLNAGHRRGQVAGRCVVRGKTVETEELPAYAAVALAGLGDDLPDTILSRSIIIRMRKRHAGERVEPFRRRIHLADGTRVREAIETWVRAHGHEIKWPDLPEEIQDRDADIWEALVAVADAVGGEWPARARAAAVALVAVNKDREPSLGVKLLSDIRVAFGGDDQLATVDLLKRLHELEESPWADLRGKPLNDRGLARYLRLYGLKSKGIRIGDRTPRGWQRGEFLDAWERYLPPPPDKSATSPTSATPAPVASVAHVALLREAKGEAGAVCAQCGACDGKVIDQAGVKLHPECVPFWQANGGRR